MGTSAISLPIQTTMGVNANGVLPFAQQDMGFGLTIQTFPTNAVFPPPDMMMPGNPMSLGLNGSNGPAPMVIQNGGAMSAGMLLRLNLLPCLGHAQLLTCTSR